MNEEIIKTMIDIKKIYGIDTLLNSKILYSYLSDYLNNKYIGEIKLIICCLKEKIPQKILHCIEFSNIFIEQQSSFLANKYFYSKDYVKDSINCWYTVLKYTEYHHNNIKSTLNHKNTSNIFQQSNNCINHDITSTNTGTSTKDYKLNNIINNAKLGNIEYQFKLGNLYKDGLEITQDFEQAIYWFHKAAEQGYANAQFYLGRMYESGCGIPQNFMQAVNWYLRAALQGHADAQYNLGRIYVNGIGINKNFILAFYWYKKAADQGHSEAQYYIGWIYENGLGMTKINTKKAYEWYLKSAKKGHIGAKNALERIKHNYNKFNI